MIGAATTAPRQIDPGKARAIRAANGVMKLADLLNISHAAISQWKRIPAARVIEIERGLKGAVTRHEMRPDLYPEESP